MPNDDEDGKGKEAKTDKPDLLQPENLQRLLADALTYRSSLRDLKTIVKYGGSVNGPVNKGLRPLHYAVHANYIPGIEYLLEEGADVDAPDDIGYRPVHLCARTGLIEPLKVLLAHGAKFDFFTSTSQEDEEARNLSYLTMEPLHMALDNGHVEVARLLLTHGARPDNRYFIGYEINCVPLDTTESLSLLLEFGADPNVFSRCGLTPLMKACRGRNIRACRILIENGAELELQPPDHFEQKTALHFALLSGSNGISNMLLRHGAIVKRHSNYKYSALHTAVVSGHPNLVSLVLSWYGQVEELTDEGSTPLQIACAQPGIEKRKEIIEVLLQWGANPNHSSHFVSYSSPYLSPLTEYMRNVMDGVAYDVVRTLLLYGAKVHFRASSTAHRQRDPHGILHCTQYVKDKPDVFHLLLSAATGFDVDSISAYTSLSPKQREVLLHACRSPRDLRTLSHLCMRDNMPGSLLQMQVPKLPVPEVIKNFLLFLKPPTYLDKYD